MAVTIGIAVDDDDRNGGVPPPGERGPRRVWRARLPPSWSRSAGVNGIMLARVRLAYELVGAGVEFVA